MHTHMKIINPSFSACRYTDSVYIHDLTSLLAQTLQQHTHFKNRTQIHNTPKNNACTNTYKTNKQRYLPLFSLSLVLLPVYSLHDLSTASTKNEIKSSSAQHVRTTTTPRPPTELIKVRPISCVPLNFTMMMPA